MTRTATALLSVALVAGGSLALAPTASAKDGDVKQRGNCSASTDWAVKVKPRNGQLRADFWVKNTAPVGQSWTLTITPRGGTPVTSTKPTRATDDNGDDDSRHTAEARWRTWAAAGPLTFAATGPNGETCSVTVG
jgi:hypothetical protein